MRLPLAFAPFAALVVFALLAGCALTHDAPTVHDGRVAPAGSAVALGRAVEVIEGQLVALPMAVVEDSRCPQDVRCVHAGRLVVTTRIDGPGWRETAALVLGQPLATHGTSLTLADAVPEMRSGEPIAPEAYRFAFEGARPLAMARIGERVAVDGPAVTPIAVLEDSRCPTGVACVQAGTVRLRVQVHLGAGTTTRELALGEPVAVADGALVLATVTPLPDAEAPIPLASYRFGFRFDGGI